MLGQWEGIVHRQTPRWMGIQGDWCGGRARWRLRVADPRLLTAEKALWLPRAEHHHERGHSGAGALAGPQGR